MFKAGDKVVYNNLEVCVVKGKETLSLGNIKKEYYILNYLFRKGENRVMIPTDKAECLQYIKSKEEMDEVIKFMPKAQNIWVDDNKVRKERYLKILMSDNREDKCSLLLTLYNKRKELEAIKKHLNLTDEEIWRNTEHVLFGEIAAANNIEYNQVLDYIAKVIKKQLMN